MQKILVIQTAFIGDVVLATGLLEKIRAYYPLSQIDILVRKGNESLFQNHPFLHEVLTWNKSGAKYRNLFHLVSLIRQRQYHKIINVQRFAATGLITVLSKAHQTIGFDKNPFSFLFSDVIRHEITVNGRDMHEIERNHQLIRSFTDDTPGKPRLYVSVDDDHAVKHLKVNPYFCIAPASVWYTKQFPAEQWANLIRTLPEGTHTYLLGSPTDHTLCGDILQQAGRDTVTNLAGQLTFLQSAALMRDAVMNYVNDSAPMHFSSAMNAPVTAVYCSTIPAFGFGPLSDISHIVEISYPLACRPCGLHGLKACPLGHFNCARLITNDQLLAVLPH